MWRGGGGRPWLARAPNNPPPPPPGGPQASACWRQRGMLSVGTLSRTGRGGNVHFDKGNPLHCTRYSRRASRPLPAVRYPRLRSVEGSARNTAAPMAPVKYSQPPLVTNRGGVPSCSPRTPSQSGLLHDTTTPENQSASFCSQLPSPCTRSTAVGDAHLRGSHFPAPTNFSEIPHPQRAPATVGLALWVTWVTCACGPGFLGCVSGLGKSGLPMECATPPPPPNHPNAHNTCTPLIGNTR